MEPWLGNNTNPEVQLSDREDMDLNISVDIEKVEQLRQLSNFAVLIHINWLSLLQHICKIQLTVLILKNVRIFL